MVDRPWLSGLRRWRLVAALLPGTIGAGGVASAQVADPFPPHSEQARLAEVVQQLFRVIETLSEHRARDAPPVFQIPQAELEAKVCDAPCNVRAAFIPREGIYLAGNLDPVHEPLDRAALLHELVHFLQQGHPRFAGLAGCQRERAKEQEAYALQNAYLAAMQRSERVVFYDSEFDCDVDGGARSP